MSVVPLSGAAGLAMVEDAEAVDEHDAPGPGPANPARVQPGFRVLRVVLRVRRAEDVAAAIKPLLSARGGMVIPLPDLHAVLLGDLSVRLPTLLDAIRALEAAGPTPVPKEFRLHRLSAAQLLEMVDKLEASRAAAGAERLRGELVAGAAEQSVLLIAPEAEWARWAELIASLEESEALRTMSFALGDAQPLEVATSLERLVGGDWAGSGFLILGDPATGTILVVGTAYQQQRTASLLEQVLTAQQGAPRVSRMFRLQNRDAEEVLGVLQGLISSGQIAGESGPTAGGGAALLGIALESRGAPGETRSGVPEAAESGHRGTTAAQVGPRLVVDPGVNAILATGSGGELDRIEQLLHDLDVRRPQVLLEVLIISLSESDSLDLGVEIEKLINGPNDTIAKLSSLFGLSSTGSASSSIGDRGAGFSGIVLNPGDFSVVLRALKSLNHGRSLSMPQVLVASNEQASINSVLEQPYTTVNA
ncbi:MAG: hypothetical protein IPJ41_17010 [Phycisphaerales bacterium]|nr:hypothetical protein [Phycisphaerales bacterium]